jgi:hypothetical protein
MKVTIDLAEAGHTERLKYVGILDLDGLFKTMYQWYNDYGYEFHEKTVKHKVPGPLGADQEIEWTGWRKINGYVKFWVDVYFHLWQLKDVEVIKEGKKVKLSRARMLIEFSGRVDLDYSNRFGGSRFLQALQDWYHKFVIKKEIDSIYTDQLYYRILKLYTVCKEYLDMEAKHNASLRRW